MATKRRIAALAAALLGTGLAASAQAQAPVPIGPTTDMTARYGPAAMPAPGGFPGGPAPYGMSPAYGPGYGPGAPIGMTPGAGPGMPPAGSSAPPGMPMPAAPPGMGGMPPGMMPPQPPAGLGLPNNLQREVEGNAYTPPLEDPDRKETDPSRWTVGIEPFFLFHRGIRLPVTVTTGNSVLDPVPGALNEPTTQILNGGAAYNGGTYFGTNFRLGYAILDQDRLFLDASYFITESKATYFDAGSDTSGNPVLSRPYFDPTAKTFNVDPRSFPNVLAGTVHDETSTRYQGAQLNLKLNFTQNGKA
ncbi:MAG TPA: BBP7 family outer membrane beta-barrel protein, partial [Gemmataceae bacterium]|nr:BBP7 family outer membrane beta-barrel protein [Gemmataceae bacterium]